MNSVLSDRALNRATLARQLLLERHTLPVVKAVEQVLALQAQVPKPPHIGLWTRLEKFDRKDLLSPLHARRLVRATSMRGTIHIMSAKDFVAFRGALQPALTAGWKSVAGKAPMPPIDKLLAAGARFLKDGAYTFNEIRAEFVRQFPKGHDRIMGYAMRMHVPLVQVPTREDEWGFPADAAFALADKWLKTPIGAGEGSSALVLRYLAAFGPATAADIQTWTGLRGIAELLTPMRSKLVTFRDERGRELFDLPKAPRPDADSPAPVRFLPEYDSVMLAHADRSRIVRDTFRKALVSKNLIVPATFLVDGRIEGTWKLEIRKKAATVVLAPFAPVSKRVRAELEEEGERLARFVVPEAAAVGVK